MATSKKKGDNYEDFVENVYKSILAAEANNDEIHPIILEKKKIIIGTDGSKNEIDIYWEFMSGGSTYKTAIECKYRSAANIPVKEVRDFVYKIEICNISKGIFVSNTGFADGSKKVATNKGIELYKLRELEEKDWDGFIKEFRINIHIQQAAKTTKFEPYIDKEWAKINNPNLDVVDLNTEDVILQDRSDGFETTIRQMEEKKFDSKINEAGQWRRAFKDGWLIIPNAEYKIIGVIIDYEIPETQTIDAHFDLTKDVLAIQEVISEDFEVVSQKLIMKDGNIVKRKKINDNT